MRVAINQKYLEKINSNLSLDTQNMFEILKSFPQQVNESIHIGKSCPLFKSFDKPLDILIAGMGGSAIGGDLLKSYCSSTIGANHLRININRHYKLLAPINNHTYFIASSYSGNTEETLSAFREGKKSTEHLLCIASGGELEKQAIENSVPLIKIPAGFMPRAALGYSFFPLLYILMRTNAFKKNAITETESAIKETIETLNVLSERYSRINDKNQALKIAVELFGKIPILYSSSLGYDSVNLRWRCQIQENAKNATFGNLLPEMNHNEINAFSYPEHFKKNCVIVFLKDSNELQKIEKRYKAIQKIFKSFNIPVIQYINTGKYLLTRLFNSVYTGDWVSYYLALLNETDPTPIPIIAKLKSFID